MDERRRHVLRLLKPSIVNTTAVERGAEAPAGYAGRWEQDARGRQVLAFDVPRDQALAFINGESVRVVAPELGLVECHVQGVRLRPRYEASQVLAHVVGPATPIAGSLAP